VTVGHFLGESIVKDTRNIWINEITWIFSDLTSISNISFSFGTSHVVTLTFSNGLSAIVTFDIWRGIRLQMSLMFSPISNLLLKHITHWLLKKTWGLHLALLKYNYGCRDTNLTDFKHSDLSNHSEFSWQNIL
jgi:hypothetical protein